MEHFRCIACRIKGTAPQDDLIAICRFHLDIVVVKKWWLPRAILGRNSLIDAMRPKTYLQCSELKWVPSGLELKNLPGEIIRTIRRRSLLLRPSQTKETVSRLPNHMTDPADVPTGRVANTYSKIIRWNQY